MVGRCRGFTLLETLIGLALTGMLLVVLASSSFAFMRMAREGEVAQRLQRELVFAAEAIETEVRVAKDVIEVVEGAEWKIVQIIHDGTEFQDSTVVIRFDETNSQLKLGNRILSKNVAGFSLVTPDARPDVRIMGIETIGQMAMVTSGTLPLRVDTHVVLRNFWFEARLVVYPNAPVYDPHPSQNYYRSITLSWTTSFPTTYILRHQAPDMGWRLVDKTDIEPSTVHSYTLSSQGGSQYLVEGVSYGWSVTVYYDQTAFSTGELSF